MKTLTCFSVSVVRGLFWLLDLRTAQWNCGTSPQVPNWQRPRISELATSKAEYHCSLWVVVFCVLKTIYAFVLLIRNGNSNRLRSLRTFPTKSTPVHALRVSHIEHFRGITKLVVDQAYAKTRFLTHAVFSEKSVVCCRSALPTRKLINPMEWASPRLLLLHS